MRPVKTRPRFRCDFCRRTATKEGMERHEKICWLNPNRYCPLCNNTGVMEVDNGYPYPYNTPTEEPCYYCKDEKKELIEELLVLRHFGEDYQ